LRVQVSFTTSSSRSRVPGHDTVMLVFVPVHVVLLSVDAELRVIVYGLPTGMPGIVNSVSRSALMSTVPDLLKPLGPVSEYVTVLVWVVRPMRNPISTVPVLSPPAAVDGSLVEGVGAPVEQPTAHAVPTASPSASSILPIGDFIAMTSRVRFASPPAERPGTIARPPFIKTRASLGPLSQIGVKAQLSWARTSLIGARAGERESSRFRKGVSDFRRPSARS
jgi:hypothetical protein